MRHTLVRRAAFAVGAAALTVPFAFAAGAVFAADPRHDLAGSTPAWAKPANRAGTPQSSQRVTVHVNLNLRNAGEAQQLATAVATPGNASYGHYLTAAAFNKRFAPTDSQVGKVRQYLGDQGLHVVNVAQGNRWVEASGTVSQLDKVFDTKLTTYRYRGHTLRAPATEPSVPASISSLVMSVSGLTDTGALRRPFHQQVNGSTSGTASPAADQPPAADCSNFWGEHNQTMPKAYGRTEFPTYICGYGADQLQTAYGVKSSIAQGKDGTGATIAIVDAYASPTMKADANKWSLANGVPTFSRGQYAEKVFKPFTLKHLCGGEDGWNGEEAIDVEAAHGLAPGANIRYVGAKNCDTGLDTALNWIVQNHTADIVSDSWGDTGEDIPASDIKSENSIFVQAAIEGIGMYFSSGDYGDNVTAGATDSAQPDFPASDPFVTAVGGTSLAIDSDNSYEFETGWGSTADKVDYSGATAAYSEAVPGSFYAGAGGGTSTLFAQPGYQQGVVPTGLSGTGDSAMRVVPDVAALADPYTGMAVGRTIDGTYTVETWGGTSLACPLFAGVQADASTDRPVSIGFANPLLYSLGQSNAYRDTVPHSNPVAVATPSGSALVTFDRDSSLTTMYGYDNVTGLGSPNGDKYIKSVASGY
jgi:subtilase family serine protease